MTDFKELRTWATVRQLEYIEAIEANGGYRQAARKLGVNHETVRESIKSLEKKAARQGHAPGHFQNGVAPGYLMGKVTVQRSRTGEVERTWERQSPEDSAIMEAIKAATEAVKESIPRQKAVTSPHHVNEDLCSVYTLTDSHVGALCWGYETKSGDWDLKIAEDTLVGCFKQMVSSSPNSKVGVIAQLGDYLHYDSALSPVTPLHSNVLDSDGRMPKMVKTAIRILRTVVDLALSKHEHVVLLLAEGNHDISSSVWLRAMFQALYEKEPRITVIDSELPYYVYCHGETMLAWHHGHLKKNDELPMLFAAQFPKDWGSTTRRYAHCGHRHHTEEKEHSGMTVIQHPTLAARDAYAARGGWIADRQVSAITYHRKYGQVARTTVVPEMVSQ